MSDLNNKSKIKNEIQVITNNRALFTSIHGDHYYKGQIITQSNDEEINKSGNFDIINKRSVDIDSNKVNNIKSLNIDNKKTR